jgi:hypothetical protein
MIKIFEKRPDTLRAIQWTGDNFDECKSLCPEITRNNEFSAPDTLVYWASTSVNAIYIGGWVTKDGNNHTWLRSDDEMKQYYREVDNA